MDTEQIIQTVRNDIADLIEREIAISGVSCIDFKKLLQAIRDGNY